MNSKAQAALATSIILLGLAGFGFAMIVITLDELDTTGADATSETFLSNVNTVNTLSNNPSEWTSLQVYNQTWLEFDGVNDRIQFPDSLEYFQANRTNNFTVGAWFLTNDNTTNQDLFYLKDIGRWEVILIGSDAKTQLTFINGSGTTRTVKTNNLTNNNEWNHIVINFENGKVRFYWNGVADKAVVTSYQNEGIESGTSGVNRVGEDGLSANRDWNGSIDFPFITNQTLNRYQIQEIYSTKVKGRHIPILNYHGINNSWPTSVYTNLTNFEEQLNWLNSSGYTSILWNNFYDWSVSNSFIMPEKPVLLSFDDGSLDQHDNALPLMNKYGFIGNLNIDTGNVGAGNNMNWTMIQNISDYGWEIGSHAVNHTSMIGMSVASRLYEFNQSRWYIFYNISIMPTTFVFPYNNATDDLHAECASYYNQCVNFTADYDKPVWTHKMENITRIGMKNQQTFQEYKEDVDPYLDVSLKFKLDENTGTIAYDVSGNGNNGTVSGATYNNDGIFSTLTRDTDYTQNQDEVTIINSDHAWSQATANYLLSSTGIRNTVTGYGSLGDYWVIIILTVVAGAVITIIFSSFRRVR